MMRSQLLHSRESWKSKCGLLKFEQDRVARCGWHHHAESTMDLVAVTSLEVLNAQAKSPDELIDIALSGP